MNKNIQTWTERCTNGKHNFASFNEARDAEISDLRAYITELESKHEKMRVLACEASARVLVLKRELESRPAAPVVAEGVMRFDCILTPEGKAEMYASETGAYVWYDHVLAAHPVAGSPVPVPGLGSLTNEEDGVLTLRFKDEDAAQAFMHSHSPTVDCRDMPDVAGLPAKCVKCKGTGMADSGGVQPWGDAILIPCDCSAAAEPMPASEAAKLPNGWVALSIVFDEDMEYPEEVAYGPPAMMDRLSKKLDKYYSHIIARRDAAPVPASEAVAERDNRHDIGAMMANVMFNLAQKSGQAITEREAEAMDKLRKQWDEASFAAPVLAAVGVEKPQQGGDDSAEKMQRMAVQSMADCMDMVRGDLIEMGIIDKSVAPMFIPEAVANHINRLKATISAAQPAAAPAPTDAGIPISDDAFGFALMEHLGPAALTGGKMSPYRAFELGWQARGQQQAGVAEGFVIAPIEPTAEMKLASKRYKASTKITTGPGFYRAMIAAVPSVPGEA